MFDATCKRSAKTYSVSRSSYQPMEILAVKWNVVFEIIKVLLNDTFAEMDESSGIKNIIS